MNTSALARLSVGSSTYQSSMATMSPVDSQFSTSSVTSESIVASPVDVKSDPDDLITSPSIETPKELISPTEVPQKRKRGRPRKHPIISVKPKNGRSRTGCITCRKRKKKCDETRPECLNCKHMNKVCEGFYLPERWQSGRSKPESRRPSLPALINGIECDEDRMLLNHFMLNVSQSLCLCADEKSPFNTLIVPMALQDEGLMHAVLCLSGYQLSGNHSKSQIPDNVRPGVIKRRFHHLDRAVSLLRQKIAAHQRATSDGSPVPYDDATLAHIGMLFLRSVVAGESDGEHTCHLDAGCNVALACPVRTSEVGRFLTEFFAYHDITYSMISPGRRSFFIDDTFRLPAFVPAAAGSYLGVLDGLFVNISKITNLREHIRQRRAAGREPLLDSATLHEAARIDFDLHEGQLRPGDETPRELVRQLYRQCTWIYLYRTIYISGPVERLIAGVEAGLTLLNRLRDEDSVQPVLLMPVFLLGCAAFEAAHRPDVETALESLEKRRGNGNIQHVRTVITEVWAMMDEGNRDSWDWETVMQNMNLNFQIS